MTFKKENLKKALFIPVKLPFGTLEFDSFKVTFPGSLQKKLVFPSARIPVFFSPTVSNFYRLIIHRQQLQSVLTSQKGWRRAKDANVITYVELSL